MTTTSSRLGPYTKYEVPATLLHTFYEDDGTTPIDLTGYTVEVHWWIKGQSPEDTVQVFAGALNDATNGIVSVPWSSAPEVFEEVGPHEVQIYAGDTVNRYASRIFRFSVLASIAAAEPSV